jgi:hypothetical protein
MLLPRVRFTVRALMVAVAVVALSYEAHAVHRRWDYCRNAALNYDAAAEFWLADSDTAPKHMLCGTYLGSMTAEEQKRYLASLPVPPTAAEYRVACLRTVRHHLEIKRKFERAAWRWWESVPAEPPEPDCELH